MDQHFPVNALLIDYRPATTTKGFTPKEPAHARAGDLSFTIQPFNNINSAAPGTAKAFKEKPSLMARAILREPPSNINPWDLAHHFRQHNKDFQLRFVEPDIVHVNDAAYRQQLTKNITRSFGTKDAPGLYDEEWTHPATKTIWHADHDYSQLKAAREAVAGLSANVRIAHLDTGFIKGHSMLPDHLRLELQKSFGHDDDNQNDASDRGNPIINGIGHGTSTMSLLAGKKVNYPDYNFNDFLGGAPWAEIIPVRVSRSVVLLSTSSFVEALDYVIGLGNNAATRCDIVTMSMGGLPTRAWATAVNAAYDNGIFVTAASGDNTGGLPTRRTVYPARFGRVVNVTGVCYDGTPYYHGNILHTQSVQGNFGPEFLMGNAIAAFTPNTPWIIHDKDNNVPLDKIGLGGAGTSASTPQVAAAAANYIRKYRTDLDKLEPWQKVEAIRAALFSSAGKTNPVGNNFKLYFGNGILKANDALALAVDEAGLTRQPEDKVSFALFHLLFRAIQPVNTADELFNEMVEVEMMQIITGDDYLQELLEPVQYNFSALNKTKKKKLLDAVISSAKASETLKTFLKTNYIKIINA